MKTADVYPADAILANPDTADPISVEQSGSIPGLFSERLKRSADHPAYVEFEPSAQVWQEISWREMSGRVNRLYSAIRSESVARGERAVIRLNNGVNWVSCDLALLSAGLVVVPAYTEDRPDNVAYIIHQTEARLLFVQSLEQWTEMADETADLASLQRVVVMDETEDVRSASDPRLVGFDSWLDAGESGGTFEFNDQLDAIDAHSLATIVFTSGTTGKPKGVMLSHHNMLATAYGGLQSVVTGPADRFLSFLPLSHMFERTVGYYYTMMAGSSVAFNRSIPELLDDLAAVKPTAMITVPRIFERAYAKIKTQVDEGSAVKAFLFNKAVEIGWQRFEIRQGRAIWSPAQLLWPVLKVLVAKKVAARFGGNLRFVVSGGAPLAPNIARLFIGLGIEILQGYGLTEASPVLTVNTLDHNKPSTIGLPLRSAELRVDDSGELQANGPSVMLGYWNNEDATRDTMTSDGWLKTGDIAAIDEQGFISITGRIKEIIVMANGEKVPPSDMEAAICDNPLFEQSMVMGEGRSFLTALVVLNPDAWPQFANTLGVAADSASALDDESVKEAVIKKISSQLEDFPGYAVIRKVVLTKEVWTVDDGSLTPTLKVKRPVLRERFKSEIASMYAGH
ncbi:MAG: long-chain fatty acid--CoA ligase [Pseudomonadota bacterium]